MLTPTPICIVEPMRIRVWPVRTWSHKGWRRFGSVMSWTQAISLRALMSADTHTEIETKFDASGEVDNGVGHAGRVGRCGVLEPAGG